jgi:hypothetical protein
LPNEDGIKLICVGDEGLVKARSAGTLGMTEWSKLLVTKISAAQIQGLAAEAENAKAWSSGIDLFPKST